MTETEIQKNILDYLKTIGVVAWRTNSGKARYNVSLAPNGTADIVGYLPDGRFLGIEVKKPNGKLSDKQAEWHEKAKKAGCAVLVAYSLHDVVDYFVKPHVADYIEKELGGIE